MGKYETLEDIRQTIILTLFYDKNGLFTNNVPEYDESYLREIYHLVHQADTDQDQIRHVNVFEGHIANTWKVAQDACYRLDPSNRRNRRA